MAVARQSSFVATTCQSRNSIKAYPHLFLSWPPTSHLGFHFRHIGGTLRIRVMTRLCADFITVISCLFWTSHHHSQNLNHPSFFTYTSQRSNSNNFWSLHFWAECCSAFWSVVRFAQNTFGEKWNKLATSIISKRRCPYLHLLPMALLWPLAFCGHFSFGLLLLLGVK